MNPIKAQSKLTAHVADDLITEIILPVPTQLQIALEPLHIGLELDGQRERVLARVLVTLLVPVSAFPARVTASTNRFRVGAVDFVVFRQTRLVKVITSLAVGESSCRAVTSISGKQSD